MKDNPLALPGLNEPKGNEMKNKCAVAAQPIGGNKNDLLHFSRDMAKFMAALNLRGIDHQSELVKLLNQVSPGKRRCDVFSDFVAVCAIWVSVAADPESRREREDEYRQIVARYTEDDVERFARGFAHVGGGLASGFCDFLGDAYMAMEIENRQQGQFFTPFDLSLLLAELQLDGVRKSCEKSGFATFHDPCVGAGSMLIACAKVMRDKGLNYQKQMHAMAIDTDIVAVHMAYIQFSLLHIPAVVIHGNALTGTAHSEWRTPAHVMGLWDRRLNLQSPNTRLDRVLARCSTSTKLSEI